MRTKQEIKQAVAILCHKADRLSLVMATVLQSSMTEQQVFQKYVMETSEADRDETVFFAARDAARYLKGDIDLDVLIPGVPEGNLDESFFAEDEAGTITLSRKDFNLLLKRIDRLEQWIGLSRKEATQKPIDMPTDADMTDMIKQNEACKHFACGKNTIKRWVAKGLIHAYQQGKYVYYSKKELDKKIRKLRLEN